MLDGIPIAAGVVNTNLFARNDIHWTDIIHVPIADINRMKTETNKGFKLPTNGGDLTGTEYRNGNTECPYNGGKLNGDNTNPNTDPDTYFYKGFGNADCIGFLEELGII
ncbi:MAG: hypothetical protein IPM71_13820 [Bacteroidota bacterium]|nr:MAG: hypothetical protein IPM71_13820 [Bacteroidota bacterium]